MTLLSFPPVPTAVCRSPRGVPRPSSSRLPGPSPGLLRLALTALLLALASLPACAPEVPNLHNPGRVIVCLGDSITAGVGSGGAPGYPELLEAELGVPVVNQGVPGDTTGGGLARLDRALAEDPWLVIIALGGNDLLRGVPAATTEANLRALVEGVLEAGAIPLVVTLDGGPLLSRMRGDLGPVWERLEEDYSVPMMEGVLDDVLMSPRLKSDTIHPNADGYAELAEELAAEVRPLLRARGEP